MVLRINYLSGVSYDCKKVHKIYIFALFFVDLWLYWAYTVSMIKKNLYFTKKELEALKRLSQETGLKFSELVRRIIDAYFEQIENKKEARRSTTIY